LEPKNLVFHRNAIFWFTNGEKQDRAACTLGFATHSSYYKNLYHNYRALLIECFLKQVTKYYQKSLKRASKFRTKRTIPNRILLLIEHSVHL